MMNAKRKADKHGAVYSTNPDFEFEYENEEIETLPNNEQLLRIQLDKKQRKGKSVTLITNFVGNEDDLKSLGKMLKSKCGVGGSAKNNEIIIQGDLRKKVQEILSKEGYKTKLL